MNLPFTRAGEPDVERLKVGLMALAGFTVLAGIAGGYLGFLADKEASSKESALAARQLARSRRDDDLQAAISSTGSESASGIQAIRSFQESIDRLAAVHQVKITSFQTGTTLAPMKSSYGTEEAPGWGMALVDVAFTGSSRSVFGFVRELATAGSPFEVEKAYFEPSLPSPNGGTQVGVTLNLKVYAKEKAV